jgi:hypothetical protein
VSSEDARSHPLGVASEPLADQQNQSGGQLCYGDIHHDVRYSS